MSGEDSSICYSSTNKSNYSPGSSGNNGRGVSGIHAPFSLFSSKSFSIKVSGGYFSA